MAAGTGLPALARTTLLHLWLVRLTALGSDVAWVKA
jgi:hypothetical protein